MAMSRFDDVLVPNDQQDLDEQRNKLVSLLKKQFNENDQLKHISIAVDRMVCVIEKKLESCVGQILGNQKLSPMVKGIVGGIAHVALSLVYKWITCIFIALKNDDVRNSLREGGSKARNKCLENGGSSFAGYLEYAKEFIALFANLLKVCFLRAFDMLHLETDVESKQVVENAVNAAIDGALNLNNLDSSGNPQLEATNN